MSTHARPLAVRLAAASDDELTALFLARGVRTDAPWQDFFDAAEALLEPASIERALVSLPLADAAALLDATRGGAQSVLRLTALALQDPSGAVPVPVAEHVAGRTLPDTADEKPPVAASESESAPIAERAFTTASRIADMLLVAREAPLGLLATGSLAAGEKKRLAEAGIGQDADDLRTIAEDAGLLRASERRVQVTTEADAWLSLPFADRWARLATAFREALPAGARDGDGWLPPAAWLHAYPWDPSWPERGEGLRRRALLLGLMTAAGTEPEWAAALRRGDRVDTTALERLVPAEVDRVFLQNDLTAIAPGPLQSGLEVRLRGMAERDSAQSSSYRFTAESIDRALIEGETEASVLDFLGRSRSPACPSRWRTWSGRPRSVTVWCGCGRRNPEPWSPAATRTWSRPSASTGACVRSASPPRTACWSRASAPRRCTGRWWTRATRRRSSTPRVRRSRCVVRLRSTRSLALRRPTRR
ncbi:helicase-associated domain-containing protein [Microbacterium sp. KUDC0406]|uniref:helicase-associated domain-containing protein n=1 Tax=Microbacterium sp. KUDC0406 TaxID=2909588 RepID=UPI001F2BDEFB|nr:helicase-associated domain-containing protein [Microbacterium sp. KUDC0406]UJP10456.1 helicase-associated domain-containing protein [Microbacterium sp. KUDC0406]